MEHYVVDGNSTLLVTRNPDDNGFIVRRLASIDPKDSIFMKDSQFSGNHFKYENDFCTHLTKKFKGTNKVVISTQALKSLQRIIEFNRIDY